MQLLGWWTRLGKCRRLLTRGPVMGRKEGRPGILVLREHPPSRAFPVPGEHPVGQRARVWRCVGNPPSSVAPRRYSDME